MKVGIMQPYFLPYLGYWQLINAVDIYVIYDDVNFINKSWINRNNIILNGNKHQINLLLSQASQNKLINEIEIQPNQNKLLKTIEQSYKKAPMFDEVFALFVEIMEYPDKNLSKFLGNSILRISKYLSIETQIIFSSAIEKNDTLKSQDKVLSICKTLNATSYLNAIGGKELYNKIEFKKQNIELNFLDTKIKSYSQFKNDFVPYLSIIDILMFNESFTLKNMLTEYSIIQ